MKKIFKILIFLTLCFQCTSAIDARSWYLSYKPTECSLSLYRGQIKCVKLVYLEINERLDRVYKELITLLPKDNSTKLIKEYNLWLKQKDEFCSRHSNDEIKLKSCHIDFAIPKLNELWNMEWEIENIKNKFEGKWTSCAEYVDGVSCLSYFLIWQDNNICGNWQNFVEYSSYIERFAGRALYRMDGDKLSSIKACTDRVDIFDEDCYDDMEYKDNIISHWTNTDFGETDFQQVFQKEPFKTMIKTPFLPTERDELIKDNKWLQDCLNYKGE
jgi:uncharacterized protein YecT (DUF1311 family)